MKTLLVALLALCCFAGCGGGKTGNQAATSDTKSEPPMHKDGEGILLCEATKESITLRTAEVSERKDGGESILVAPKPAILHTTAGNSVFVENGGHYKRTVVKEGRAFGDLVEITEGLYEGDRVVTNGAQTLWLIELRAVKGGKGCCPMPGAKKDKPAKASHAH